MNIRKIQLQFEVVFCFVDNTAVKYDRRKRKMKQFILPTIACPVKLQFNIAKCARIIYIILKKGDTGRYEYAHEQKNLHFNCGLLFEFCTNEQNSLKKFFRLPKKWIY